jgi:hypothetical protein
LSKFKNKTMLSVKGKIYQIQDIQKINDTFSKREFVLELTNDDQVYVQKVSFSLLRDNVNLVDGLEKGQEVEVKFYLNGRDWTSPQGEVKFFNTLDAQEVNLLNKLNSDNLNNQNSLNQVVQTDSDDDLPF